MMSKVVEALPGPIRHIKKDQEHIAMEIVKGAGHNGINQEMINMMFQVNLRMLHLLEICPPRLFKEI
jgi:hypothetical protein